MNGAPIVGVWYRSVSEAVNGGPGMFEIYGLAPGSVCSLETALQRSTSTIKRPWSEPSGAASRAVSRTPPITTSCIRMAASAGYTPLNASSWAQNGDPELMRGLTWDVTDRQAKRVPG